MRRRPCRVPSRTCAVALLLITILSACGTKEDRKTSPGTGDDRYGGTLVVGIIGDVDALNPLVSSTRGASDMRA